jgi:integrase
MTTPQNPNSGQESVKKTPPTAASSAPIRHLPKTHKDYWKARLERRCYTHKGKLVEVNEWSVRIQHLGQRRSFALGTNNAETAAVKARDIYLAVLAKGWDQAQALYNPEMVVSKDDPTVGEFLTEMESKSDLKPRTFRRYSRLLRRIVADTFGLGKGRGRPSEGGAYRSWREKVDRVRLGALGADQLNAWRTAYIRKAGTNPVARQGAIRTANDHLRAVRALFSRKWIARLQIRLPDPLPFTGVQLESPRPARYQSTIDAAILFGDARKELAPTDPGAYLAFLLALGAGLRKAEIDGLEWRHVNSTRAVILVEPTEYRGLKSAESAAEVQIDPALAEELRQYKPEGEPQFVIESPLLALKVDRQYYRAEPVFQRLYGWLRSKGIKSRCPLHTLRKEFGSLINAQYGLYAAMTALRHSGIAITSGFYVDNKRRIALPMAGYFKGASPDQEKPLSNAKTPVNEAVIWPVK